MTQVIADELFRSRVHCGGVDGIDARVEQVVEHAGVFRVVRFQISGGGSTETKHRDVQTCAAERSSFHEWILAARIEMTMAAGYPIVLDVSDRLAVIVGGGVVGSRKARGLLASG